MENKGNTESLENTESDENNVINEVTSSKKLENTPTTISLSIPNTAGIDPTRWTAQRLNTFEKHSTYFAIAIDFLVLAGLAFVWPFFSVEWISAGLLAVFVLHVIVFNVRDALLDRKVARRQAYRIEIVPTLSALFEEHGFTLPKESEEILSHHLHSSVTIRNSDGIRYHTWEILVEDNEITAHLWLIDKGASDNKAGSYRENRVKLLVEEYVAKNGEFASPEIREAFIEGVKAAT